MGFGVYGISDLAVRNYAASSEVKEQAQEPATPRASGSAPGSAALHERGRRAKLLKLLQEKTTTVKNIFDASEIAVAGMQGQSPHRTQNREKVAKILDDTLERFTKVESLLFSETRPTGKSGITKRKTTFKQLCKHLDAIKELTANFESPAGGEDAADEPAAPKENAAHTDKGKAANNTTYEEKIIQKCLEVIDALTPLCIAADRPVSTEDSVFDHYFQINDALPLGDRLEGMLVHAALAQTVYANDLSGNFGEAAPLLSKTWPDSWDSMALPDHFHQLLKDICPSLQKLEDGRFIDPDSGLVMQVFENQTTKQATIAFGGTSAGASKGSLVRRLLQNPWMTARQWRANLCNATGISIFGGAPPDSYMRAASVAGLLNQYLKTNRGEGWTLSLTGHSKGAAEAQYAALSNQLPAVCFGTPHLGRRVLETLSREELEAGSHNIQHYFVKGDLSPRVGNMVAPVLGRMQGHVGCGYWMEPTSEVGNGLLKALWCHDLFFKTALIEAARQKNPPA
jgi:hypothetical protein